MKLMCNSQADDYKISATWEATQAKNSIFILVFVILFPDFILFIQFSLILFKKKKTIVKNVVTQISKKV